MDSRLDAERPLEEGETDESFIETELDANPTLMDMTSAALDVLEDDQDGFWLSIEGGDIDWAAHDNNLDNMLGTTMDFAESVEIVMDWIEENGGYEETQLIVTADHDHYFTLTEDYPQLLREEGAEAMTVQVGEDGEPLLTDVDEEGEPLVDDDGNSFQLKVDNEDVSASGHYWGSDPNEKYGWGTHTTRPVPVYYEGVGSEFFEEVTGEGYEAYGEEVAGVDGFIDQVHIGEAQFNAFGITPGENTGMTDAGGLDTLTGAEGADTFILGDEETGAFYSSSGFDDYAEISNFVSGEDSIQLAGSLEDYSFLADGGTNVAIALDNDGDGAFDLAFDEFVALVGDGFETTDLVFV